MNNTSGLLVGGINRVSWVDEAQERRDSRGQWALLTARRNQHGARTMASEINRGALWAFQPAGDFEAEAHGRTVWVRYLGDGA